MWEEGIWAMWVMWVMAICQGNGGMRMWKRWLHEHWPEEGATISPMHWPSMDNPVSSTTHQQQMPTDCNCSQGTLISFVWWMHVWTLLSSLQWQSIVLRWWNSTLPMSCPSLSMLSSFSLAKHLMHFSLQVTREADSTWLLLSSPCPIAPWYSLLSCSPSVSLCVAALCFAAMGSS